MFSSQKNSLNCDPTATKTPMETLGLHTTSVISRIFNPKYLLQMQIVPRVGTENNCVI